MKMKTSNEMEWERYMYIPDMMWHDNKVQPCSYVIVVYIIWTL